MAMTPAQAKAAVQDALTQLYNQGIQIQGVRVNWTPVIPATNPPTLKCIVEFEAKL